ncbi:MAG: bifunctional folylpolyglutamate synthase/dihydrofolate synthase [Bacteroidales bacterium]|nr:bifunctional folylpolyglutamate synthase/dihydrofolate synthase [Bacteroidales bacterium]
MTAFIMEEAEYKSLLDGIFLRFPSVQNAGFTGDAYKPGLDRMSQFLELLGNPQSAYKCIHVAGTNGKGSVCNMLASVLAAKGYRTGLYTSPHIIDFRERMRIVDETVDGSYEGHQDTASGRRGLGKCLPQYRQCRRPLGCHFDRSGEIYSLVPKEYVYEFLKEWSETFDKLQLSFFEITTGMAFKWFADAGVDYAVVEVGLGGRLDSTNVITPVLSIITSIGLDHCDLLGDTLEKIAFEKAGIIKPMVPVVIGEYRPETAPVFLQVASERKSPIFFAEISPLRPSNSGRNDNPVMSSEVETSQIHLDLQGEYQKANVRTVLTALAVLGLEPDLDAIAHTAARTGFAGRWEHLSEDPLVICDIGHNAHALKHNFAQLEGMMASGVYDCLIIVYAVMADKDLDSIMPLMPRRARYIFTTPKGKRALPAERILEKFVAYREISPLASLGRNDKESSPGRNDKESSPGRNDKESSPGRNDRDVAIDDVAEAVKKALLMASAYKKPIIYIGGSTFAVAEAKPEFGQK